MVQAAQAASADEAAQQKDSKEKIQIKSSSRRADSKRPSAVTFDEATLNANGQRRKRSSSSSKNANTSPELTVCDIIRDWGPYQWSLCLFASIYSGIASLVVVFGPLLTPAMNHTCDTSGPQLDQSDLTVFGRGLANSSQNPLDSLQQCFTTLESDLGELISEPCTSFIYDQNDVQRYGLMLTNKVSINIGKANS